MIFSASSVAEQISIPKPLTLTWINEQLKSHGAKYVVETLWEKRRWDDFANEIDSGKSAWVALVPKIAPGTDAATTEELAISLAYALPRNPSAVLSVLDDRMMPVSPQMVCSAPFVEDTVRDIPHYINRSRSALEKVKDDQLTKQKAECLTELEKTSKQIQARGNH